MALQPSILHTRADLDDFPDDGKRRELLDGVLLVSPAARIDHQRVVLNVASHILAWTRAADGRGTVLPEVNVELAADSHLEPDVVWTRDDAPAGLGFDHTPAFVVEVTSPSTRHIDRGGKRDRYAATGCEELWIVDIDAHTVEVSAVADRLAADPVVHGAGDTFTSPLFDGLGFDVDDLLG